jgi:hypothetical protein
MRKLIFISLILALLYYPLGCGKDNDGTSKTDQPPKKATEENFEIDHSGFDPFAKTFTRAITNGKRAHTRRSCPTQVIRAIYWKVFMEQKWML